MVRTDGNKTKLTTKLDDWVDSNVEVIRWKMCGADRLAWCMSPGLESTSTYQ